MKKVEWNFPKQDSSSRSYMDEIKTDKLNQHLRLFKVLVNYLVKLRREGDIDDKVFEYLIRQAAGSFIEAEVSGRIGNILEDKISERIDGIFDGKMMVSHVFGGVSGRLSR